MFTFINAKKIYYTPLVKNFPKLTTNQSSKQDIYLLAVLHSGKRQQGGPNGREQRYDVSVYWASVSHGLRCIPATPGVSCIFVCLPVSVYLYLSVSLFIHFPSVYVCMYV